MASVKRFNTCITILKVTQHILRVSSQCSISCFTCVSLLLSQGRHVASRVATRCLPSCWHQNILNWKTRKMARVTLTCMIRTEVKQWQIQIMKNHSVTSGTVITGLSRTVRCLVILRNKNSQRGIQLIADIKSWHTARALSPILAWSVRKCSH